MIAVNPSYASIERRPEFSGLLREDEYFSSGAGQGAGEAVNGGFDRLMIQSGIKTSPSIWLGLCVLSAVGLGGLFYISTEAPLISAALVIVGGFLPILLAVVLRSRRQKQILEQLPGMAEELARVSRSGRNLESAFQLVAADTPAPLGDELRLSARRNQMGIDLATAVRDLPLRTGVASITVFTSAVSVHQDTGGDLIAVLERLAASVRDRLHFVSRLRAATIASRLGAFMMIVIPVAVVAFYVVRDPNYLSTLMGSSLGRISLWTAIVLQFVGCAVVIRVLNRSARF